MNTLNFTAVSQEVQRLFETVAEQVAKVTQFVKRKSKLTGPGFYQILVLGWMQNPQASLNDLARFGHQLHAQLSLTPQGLDQRINPQAVAFLRQMLTESLLRLKDKYRLEVQLLKAFSQINLLDSTILSLPDSLRAAFPGSGGDASRSALKVQLLLEFLSGQYRVIDLKAGKSADHGYGWQVLPELREDSLTLMDLGYFSAPYFQALAQPGAYFLSRLQPGVHVFEALAGQKGQALDVDQLLRKAARTAFEITAVICGSHPLACRVVFLPVSPEVAAQRRRRAKQKARKQRRLIRQSRLKRLDWSIFITHVRADPLSTQTLATVYRLRWAVELTFKLWKSHGQLDQLGGKRLERVLCELYAKLIGLVLFTLLAAPARALAVVEQQRELSLPKALKILQSLAQPLAQHLDSWKGLAVFLEEQFRLLLQYGLTQRHLKDPSTYQRLEREVK